MTEKRFRISQGYSDKFCHDWAKNKLLNFRQTVDLLNNLNDENEQLKRRNKGLQSELQIFKEDVKHSNLQINKLADENEQLKSRIKELEIMNEAQSDAIDGLQETMCHLDLSELNGDVE